jgi:hypothetical protein
MNEHISKETLKRALSFARAAIKLGFAEPQAIVPEGARDFLTYVFATKSDMVIVCCCPDSYLVSYGKRNMTIKTADYLIISNQTQFLKKLKSLGYKTLSRAQLKKMEQEINGSKRPPEREPTDDELKDIEDSDD